MMEHEPTIRLSFFFGVLLIVACWELVAPRRRLTTAKHIRWLSNLGIIFFNSFVARIVLLGLGVVPVAFAANLQSHNWGLLNQLGLAYPVAVLAGVIILDFIIYLQHVMFHAVPLFWRLHMMHHADLDYDLTTGMRFHTIEIIVSLVIKLAAISVLGPPALTVIIFEILLNGAAMFNHGNIYLPEKIDRILRLIIVTPDMHRVHHSVVIRETNSNFGFNMPWWDKIFGTYKPQPVEGHKDMTIGLSQFRDPKKLTLPWMLALPFIGKPGSYAFSGHGKLPKKNKNQSSR